MLFKQHYIAKKMKETNKIQGYQLFTKSLAYEVKLTEKYSKMLGLQLFAKLGAPLSPEEFLALDVVSANPDICQRDLAKLIIKDRANTGRLLEALEKKGLIKRVVDVKNNRLVKKIVITDEGEEILHTWLKKIIPIFDRVYEKFSKEEIEQAKDVLRRMRDAFQDIVDIQI